MQTLVENNFNNSPNIAHIYFLLYKQSPMNQAEKISEPTVSLEFCYINVLPNLNITFSLKRDKEALRKLKAAFGRLEEAARGSGGREGNGELNKDKLPRTFCGEIAFTDGGRE